MTQSSSKKLIMLGYRRTKEYLHRQTLLTLWIATSCLVFWLSYKNYKHNPRFFYIHKMLGSGLCLSRGTATVLNFACFMIFMPMCRTLMTWIRSCCWASGGEKPPTSGGKGEHFWAAIKRRMVLPAFLRRLVLGLLDQSHKFHVMCAYTIIIAAGCHSVAHIFNAYNFSRYYNSQYPEINLARHHGQDPLMLILFTMPGMTGILMVVIIFILAITATESMRSKHFDAFWLAHRLVIVFVVLLVIHPMGGLLKEQINTDKHQPACNRSREVVDSGVFVLHELEAEKFIVSSGRVNESRAATSNYAEETTTETLASTEEKENQMKVEPFTTLEPSTNFFPSSTNETKETKRNPGEGDGEEARVQEEGKDDGGQGKNCLEPPKFAPLSSDTWKWLAAALTIYGADLGIRLIRRRQPTEVIGARVYEKSSVIELELAVPSICSKLPPLPGPGRPLPGSYVYLKCPQISVIEWHPFSLAASSSKWSDDSYSLQIRSTGDWTNSLQQKVVSSVAPTEKSNDCGRGEPVVDDRGPHHDQMGTVDNAVPRRSLPEVRIFMDGPFRSPAEDVLSHRVSLCVAGGIGVTPFASVLTFINSDNFRPENFKLRKLRFVWLARNRAAFENFAHLLTDVWNQLIASGKEDLLEVDLYVTQESGACSGIRTSAGNPINETDVVRFLDRKITEGKPNWQEVLHSLQVPLSQEPNSKKSSKIGVFCCGPRGLRRDLKKSCRKANISGESSFVFKRENFG